MRKSFLNLIMALFALPLLFAGNAKAGAGNVTGFLVDASVVNGLFSAGATNIKIYAGADASGNLFYVLTGADASFSTMDGQVYLQNSKGDCPPTCDFIPTNLDGGGSMIEGSVGEGYVNNYMNKFSGAKNCVKLSRATLDKVMANYPYFKVTFGSGVTVTGLNEDGTAGNKATFNEGTTCNCGM